jgi:hypothetical protein
MNTPFEGQGFDVMRKKENLETITSPADSHELTEAGF